MKKIEPIKMVIGKDSELTIALKVEELIDAFNALQEYVIEVNKRLLFTEGLSMYKPQPQEGESWAEEFDKQFNCELLTSTQMNPMEIKAFISILLTQREAAVRREALGNLKTILDKELMGTETPLELTVKVFRIIDQLQGEGK